MPEEPEVIDPQTGQDAPIAETGENAAPAPQPNDERTDVQPGDDPAGEMVSRAELEKVIAQRQAAKARARKAEQQLAELETGPVPGGEDAASGPEAAEPIAKALEGENARLKRQLTRVLRDQGLRAAAAAAGAINPDQVVALLRPRVQMQSDGDGRLKPIVLDDTGQPLADDDGALADMQTFVSLFLSLPENANLIRAGAVPGSGARPAGGAPALDGRPRSLEEFNGLPEDRRMRWAMELGPEKLRSLLGLSGRGQQGFL